MKNLFFPCLAAALLGLGSCQSTPPPAETLPLASPPTPAEAQLIVGTASQARAAVARFILTQPSPTLYVVDSARVNDDGDSWQVLVPRTDWARHMPNRARFEVSKATGFVRSGAVK